MKKKKTITYFYPFSKAQFLNNISNDNYNVIKDEKAYIFISGGHGCCTYYIANLNEIDGKTIITGIIGDDKDLLGIKKRKKTFIEIVAFVLLCLICLPIIIIISLILLFNLLLRKKVKTESTYDKLDKIMCDKLFCTKG